MWLTHVIGSLVWIAPAHRNRYPHHIIILGGAKVQWVAVGGKNPRELRALVGYVPVVGVVCFLVPLDDAVELR